MRPREGFTLYELMIVIIMIGVLAGLAWPYIDVQAHAVRSATQTVGSTLLMAQRLALTEQHDVVVAFDVADGVMRIHQDADNEGDIDDAERVRHVEFGTDVVVSRGAAPVHPLVDADAISFTAAQTGHPAITFHRDGSVGEEGGLYLTTPRAATTGAARYADDTRVFVIERATGRTSWFRFSDGAWERAF